MFRRSDSARAAFVAGVLIIQDFSLLVAQDVQRVKPLAVFQIDEQSISEGRKDFRLSAVEVDDPVYKRRQRYQGFWLRDILKKLGVANHRGSDLYLRFRCKDGYLPLMPLTRALDGQALVAVRDLHARHGQTWNVLSANGVTSTPAPSYLVWVGHPGDSDSYPWPYQMTAIEVISGSAALEGMYSSISHSDGYGHFIKHCFKCHSINGVGGSMGPELNAPCSVMDYWNPGLLKRFIRNSRNVRAGSKMPSFEDLPDKDLDSILEYLRDLAQTKVGGRSCK